MADFSWYMRRLAAMSPREIIWRIWRAGIERSAPRSAIKRTDEKMLGGADPAWRDRLCAFRHGTGRPVLLDQDRARRIAAEHPAEVQALVAEAEKFVSGERTYFGYPTTSVGTPVDWNHDPISDWHWPAAPARTIEHRSAESDPKWIWELNRLQHLPVLAQAWLFTGDERFAEVALDQLDSWLVQNPVGTGIAWRGAFEAGIRAVSVAIALQGLRTSPALTPQRYRAAVRMLDASAHYCWHGRSRFSSANNHLIGELSGLLTIHLVFPELAAPAALRDRALHDLVAEADKQLLPDGAGAEQSVSYQIFTAELLSVVHLLLRLQTGRERPELRAALDRSTGYLLGLVAADDPDPRYGDDDDGFALRLGSESKRTVRQHLGIVGALTGRTEAIRCGRHTITAAWVAASLGTNIDEIGLATRQETSATSLYARDGGLVVLRNGRHRLTMDVGPLGYLSIAAHGHADALAVTLSDQGDELIVDPGTASYYGNSAWRSAHRSTRAHATICVDGANQSVLRGPFVWGRHAKSVAGSIDLARGVVDARHDGYRRLNDPVVHRRWLIAPPNDPTIVIIDLVEAKGVHDVQVSWPLHPALEVRSDDDGHIVSRGDVAALRLCYAATVPVTVSQTHADPVTNLGWWSERLEARTPSWLVGASVRARGPMAMLTLLRTTDIETVSAPRIALEGSELTAKWYEGGVQRMVRIDTLRPGAVDAGFASTSKEMISQP